jgi:hypothetical protein
MRYKMYACEIHACEIRACEIYAYKMDVCEMQEMQRALRHTSDHLGRPEGTLVHSRVTLAGGEN